MSCCVQWMREGVAVGGEGGELGLHHGLSRQCPRGESPFRAGCLTLRPRFHPKRRRGWGEPRAKPEHHQAASALTVPVSGVLQKCTSQDLVPAPSSPRFSRHPNACDEGQAGGHLALVLDVVLSKEVDEGDLLLLNALPKEAPAG